MSTNRLFAQDFHGMAVPRHAVLPGRRAGLLRADLRPWALGVATLLAWSASGAWSPTAYGQWAAGYYNPRTGEVFFELEAGIGVVGLNTAGLFDETATPGTIGERPPETFDADILAYFDAGGLAAGYWPIGSVAPTGLQASDFGFTYIPIGSDAVVKPMGIIGEPSSARAGYISTRTSNSVVYQIDLNTGDQTALGPSGVANIRALEYFNGVLYAAADNGLYSINTATGAGSLIGPTGVIIDDLSVGPDGQLYGNAASTNEQQLLRIDVVTGQTAVVGTLAPYISTNALAINEQGRAIGWDDGAEWLFDVNLQTGASTSIGALGEQFYRATDFGADGQLYGWTGSEVRRINLDALSSTSVRPFAIPGYSFTLITEPAPFWNKQGPGAFAFDDAANWNPASAPTNVRDAYFVLDGDVEVILGTASAVRQLNFTKGSVRFVGAGPSSLNARGGMLINDIFAGSLDDAAEVVLDGSAGAVLVTLAGDLEVGRDGRGNLELVQGAELIARQVRIGAGLGAEGSVVVSGNGSALQGVVASPALLYQLGTAGGSGSLQVVQGATLSLASATSELQLGVGPGAVGAFRVAGSGSAASAGIVTVGFGGTGELAIADGGALQQVGPSSSAWLGLADAQGVPGSATALVEGANSRWSVARGEFGIDGAAEVEVRDGGRLDVSGSLVLGGNAGGVGDLAVAGTSTGQAAHVQVGADLVVGDAGRGSLDISAGGQVVATQNVWIGRNSASTQLHEVRVAGAGSLLQGNRIHVGDQARGRLDVADGGTVTAAELVLAQEASSQSEATVSGVGSRISANTLGVSTFGDASLQVIDGGLVEASWRLWVGFADGGVADIVVEGPGSTISVGGGTQANPALLIGGEPTFSGGRGSLTVAGGGLLSAVQQVLIGSNTAADGALVVTGAGSLANFASTNALEELTSVGDAGVGALSALGGGEVRSERAVVGNLLGSSGSVLLQGEGSRWTANTLTLGDQGAATLGVQQGAALITGGNAALAVQPGSSATALLGAGGGPTATWQVDGRLDVGWGTSGTGGAAALAVQADGVATVGGALRVGQAGGVLVDGGALTLGALERAPGSSFEFRRGSVNFGPSPSGERLVDAAALADLFGGAARLTPGMALSYADPITLTGRLELDGGTLSVASFNLLPAPSQLPNLEWDRGTLAITAGDLLIGSEGPLGDELYLTRRHVLEVAGGLLVEGQVNLLGAEVSFGAPSFVNAGGELNAINATLRFDGGLSVVGDVNLINTNVLGDVEMGGGALTLAGTNAFGADLQMDAGQVLLADLGGLEPAQFDRLAIQGDATLAGDLRLGLMGGFMPRPGDVFEVVSIGGQASGQFDGLPEGAMVAEFEGLKLFITYAGGDGNDVAVFARRVGADFTDDGVVDGADLQAWASSWGEDDGGDANADGATDGLDFLVWQRSFGQTTAVPASGAAVPEPATALLLLSAMAIRVRRKKHIWGDVCWLGRRRA